MHAHSFNQNLSAWDVSKVTTLHDTFHYATSFNQNLAWDVSKVTTMQDLFFNSGFGGDISAWNTENVINMYGIFNQAKAFNSDVSKWSVGKVTGMGSAFRHSSFNKVRKTTLIMTTIKYIALTLVFHLDPCCPRAFAFNFS